MPYLDHISYEPQRIFQNGHFSTIYFGLLNKFEAPAYGREKLQLPDGDFLLVDSYKKNSDLAIILCHGLEGDSRKNCNNVCANYFIERNYDIFARNNRSCGGEMNGSPLLYHHDGIDEMEFIIHHVNQKTYKYVSYRLFSWRCSNFKLIGKKKPSQYRESSRGNFVVLRFKIELSKN